MRFTVHVGYPQQGRSDDEAWVEAIARRHGGDLSDGVMESAPAQRLVRFRSLEFAQAFTDDLNATGRWTAGVIDRRLHGDDD